MVSSRLLLAGLVLAIVSAIALSLQLEWVYSTFFIFIAALVFAYAGGAPSPDSTLWTSREGIEEAEEKIKNRHAHKTYNHSSHAHKHGEQEEHSHDEDNLH